MPDMSLPKPICQYGYPYKQLREILGNRYQEFLGWMSGQTMTTCNGCELTNDWPHGFAVNPGDVERFLSGLPVVD